MTNYVGEPAIACYNMTKEQAELAQKAYDNRDTEVGYKAFYDLEMLTHDNDLDGSVLYDLAADFEWNDKLINALKKLAAENGRAGFFDEEDE